LDDCSVLIPDRFEGSRNEDPSGIAGIGFLSK
jgi:hypothetical protein